MHPAASSSPAPRPKLSHCRRERRAVTSGSLPPECPTWASRSVHPEGRAPAGGPAAQSCRSFPAPGVANDLVRQACRPLRRTRSSSARDHSARGSRVGVEPASQRRRERIQWRHVAAGVLLGLDASALLLDAGPHASSEPPRKTLHRTRTSQTFRANAGPTLGMIVRDQLATRSKPASSKNMRAERALWTTLRRTEPTQLGRTNPLQNSRLKTCFQKTNGLSICSCAPYYWDNSQPRQLLASGVCPMISRAARCRTGETGS